jgi:glycosyltransferase involved in cell wall biosynthesis
MKRKNLLVVSSTYPRWSGDPEPGFVHELSKRLISDFNVYVVCPHSNGAMDYECLDGVHIHRFRYAPKALETLVSGGGILSNIKSNRWKLLLVFPFLMCLGYKLIKIIRLIKPDVIHSHWIIPQGLILAFLSMFLKLPPMLITSHGGDLFSMDSLFMRLLKRFALRAFNKVTVVNSAMISKITDLGFCVENVNAIPMGVDLDNLFIPMREINRISHRILFVGRIVEKKGLIFLIRALAKVRSKFPTAHLVLAGAGTELDERNVRKEISDNNLSECVTWLGAVPQCMLPKLYNEAAVFVAPFVKARSGDQEGFGLVAIEAIGCLCPIILGRVSVTEEFYQRFEQPPALIDPHDISELVRAIEDVFEEPGLSLELVSRLRDKVTQCIGWNVVAGKYSSLLNEMSL